MVASPDVHPPCLGASDTLAFRGVGLQTAFLNRIELYNPGLSTHQGIDIQDIDTIGAWRGDPGASQVIFLQCSQTEARHVGTTGFNQNVLPQVRPGVPHPA